MRIKWIATFLGAVFVASLLACSSQSSSQNGAISSTEREQIQNAVRQYVTISQNTPQYTVTVEKAEGDWALVSVKPEGANAKPQYFVLRRSNSRGAPAAAPSLTSVPTSVAPGTVPAQLNQNPPSLGGITPPGETNSGWVIVLGPKSAFSRNELNAAGVPSDLWSQSTQGQ